MINVIRIKGVNRSQAILLLVRAQYELMEAGLTDKVAGIGWDDQAVVALEDGKPVGVISYSDMEWCKEFGIKYGYIVPSHRGRGIYRLMWEELVRAAQDAGRVQIGGSTRVDNATMRAVAAKLGRRESGINLKFDVPPREAKDEK